MSKPSIEFVGTGRPPFVVQGSIAVIGRNPTCALVLDGPGVDERHARLSVDAQGEVSIEDLGSQQGTYCNGQRIASKTRLGSGDTLRIGPVTLMFQAGTPIVAQDVSIKTTTTDKTMMPGELPPEVKALIAKRDAELAAQKAAAAQKAPAPASVVMAPPPSSAPAADAANIVVGTADSDAGEDGRTVVAQEIPQAVKDLLARAQQAQAAGGQAPLAAPQLSAKEQDKGRSTILGMPPMAGSSPKPTPAPTAAPAPSAVTPPSGVPAYAPPPAADAASGFAAAPAAAAVAGAAAPAPYDPHAQAYTPPAQKGAFGSFSRAFAFFGQMRDLAKAAPVIKKPILYNVVIAAVIMGVSIIPLIFVSSGGMAYGIMTLATVILYFVDYFCNALTASLIYDHVTTGNATMEAAKARVKKSVGAIAIFGAVSGVLDVASTYARERGDILAKIILGIIRAIWTTATYVMMPAIVIEEISFGDALKRSKDLMKQDPTGVGAGVVAVSLVTYIVGFLTFAVGGVLMRIGFSIWAPLGVLLWLLVVNSYWAITGWLKISYSTCFYLWAKECERTHSQDSSLAPLPLRSALDAG